MSWVEETLKSIDGDAHISKDEVKKLIAEAVHELLGIGYDWDDVEIFMVAKFRPLVGEFILLLAKWIREVRDEESGVVTH